MRNTLLEPWTGISHFWRSCNKLTYVPQSGCKVPIATLQYTMNTSVHTTDREQLLIDYSGNILGFMSTLVSFSISMIQCFWPFYWVLLFLRQSSIILSPIVWWIALVNFFIVVLYCMSIRMGWLMLSIIVRINLIKPADSS